MARINKASDLSFMGLSPGSPALIKKEKKGLDKRDKIDPRRPCLYEKSI
jgi:hypothetical protein